MLAELRKIMRNQLPILLADDKTPWQTLDVVYEDPHVERVWLQLGSKRLYLHRIHPCEKAFFHPHPWPSAIHVLTGHYKMAMGSGPAGGKPPDVTATIDLHAGSGYEMLSPSGWHSVMPYGESSLSLMLTGTPWRMAVTQHAHKAMNQPLDEAVKLAILGEISRAL